MCKLFWWLGFPIRLLMFIVLVPFILVVCLFMPKVTENFSEIWHELVMDNYEWRDMVGGK